MAATNGIVFLETFYVSAPFRLLIACKFLIFQVFHRMSWVQVFMKCRLAAWFLVFLLNICYQKYTKGIQIV